MQNKSGILHIFDIDGTLCPDGGLINSEHINILVNLKNKGHTVWFASARGLPTIYDALLHNVYLIDTKIIAENGARTQEGEIQINNHLSKKEKGLFIQEINDIGESIITIDCWIDNKLYTFNSGNLLNPLEETHRIYLEKNALLDFILEKDISMIHVVNKKQVEKIYLPKKINKSIILDNVPPYIQQINLYGNGSNDIELFARHDISIPIVRHGIGQNRSILELSDRQFLDYFELFKYMKEGFVIQE